MENQVPAWPRGWAQQAGAFFLVFKHIAQTRILQLTHCEEYRFQDILKTNGVIHAHFQTNKI
jgi:hypothetical protein